MERVAFLVEESGERIDCLLNPQSLEIRRRAGVRPRGGEMTSLTGVALADDPLLYTGGGRTELSFDLLFDVSLSDDPSTIDDVRAMTAPLWRLAENAGAEDAYGSPPLVRFVWGKSWNIPGIITAVAERLEDFTTEGSPRRSWMSMKMLRVAEPFDAQRFRNEGGPDLDSLPGPDEVAPEDLLLTDVLGSGSGPGSQARRLDEIASQYYGDPAYWRYLARFNRLDDPARLTPRQRLMIPLLDNAQEPS